MEQGPKPGSASEAMGFGLMEYADRIGLMMTSAQESLTEQVGNLQELQRWTIASVQGVQQRADTAIQRLDAERQKLEAARVKLEGTQALLQTNTVQAIHDAVEKQSGKIGRQVENALATPLHDIKQAAAQVMQNVKEANRLAMGIVFLLGMVGGLMVGYLAVMRTQNVMDDRLDRIEQSLAALQQTVTAPATIDPHAPLHKGKGK